MSAAFIVLSVFVGLSMVVATAAGAILLANGKFTLPHTNMRRVQRERTALALAQLQLEKESMQMRVDDAIQLRIERSMESAAHRPSSDLIKREEESA